MKILCVIDSLGSGGAQRQMVELAKGFKERGYEVSFLTYHNINFFKPDLDQYNISVNVVLEVNYFRRFLKIRKAIRLLKPDAVLSFQEQANFMATLAGFPFKSWKLIVGERSANPLIKKSFKKIFLRWFHLFSDYVVANSYANMDIVQQVSPLLNKCKCKIIYNSIDFNKWVHNTKKLDNEKFHLLVVGRYHFLKNAHGLIEAIHLLPEDLKKQITVDWYGEKVMPEYFLQITKLVSEYRLENTVFLNDSYGKIEEKYLKSDYIGLFSFHEGFPNTISEAMAMKKPIISTMISDIPFFIKNHENGFTCSPHDISSIKNALTRAIKSTSEERLRYGNLNYKIAKNNFEREEILNKYLMLLT